MKWIIFLIVVIKTLYLFILDNIKHKQRSKPLPSEVSDIYDQERYQSFIDYEEDYDHMRLIKRILNLVLICIYLFSPLLTYIDQLHLNVYATTFLTMFIIFVIDKIIDISCGYYATFVIEEKYHKNKKTIKLFIKDEVIEVLLDIILTFGLTGICIFFFEHIEKWTHNFSITYTQSFIFSIGLVIVIGVLYLILMGISYFYLQTQYKFTELEEGELRASIEDLMKDCDKKVKHIKVYNESKKSTGKNAFLLKILGYREFGIADNFLDENSYNELLAVLSHEIGHLKHKKNIFNYIKYIVLVCVFLFVVYLIPHGQIGVMLSNYVLKSFGLTHMNYDVILAVLSYLCTPLFYLVSFYMNYVSRREEYEADDQAVKNGYGKELIDTFKRLSSDELIDVYPADFIEFTSYDHPGMYHRIKHIEEKMKEGKS